MAAFLSSLFLLAPVAMPAQDPIFAATANLHQVQRAYGRGAQLYSCRPINGTPAFIFLGPGAILYQAEHSNVEQVATHSIGPVWQWNDGSGVFGMTLQTIPAPNPSADIATLILSAQPFGTKNGVLSGVTVVTRSGSVGGVAPISGCDTNHIGTLASVPYSAIYTFFSPGK